MPTLEEHWMAQALAEAQAAFDEGEAPIGAVIVDAESHRIVARAHLQSAMLKDPTAHAAMLALTQLHASDPDEALTEAIHGLEPRAAPEHSALVLVSTSEPCLMCAGALLLNPAVLKVVYGMRDPAWGACGSAHQILGAKDSKHPIEVVGGVLAARIMALWDRHQKRRHAGHN